MADGNVATDFRENAQRPQPVDAEKYRAILEKLVTLGSGFGKTTPVAAYLMKDIEIERQDEAGNVLGIEQIELKPVYVVMDAKYLRNEFARQVTMKDIGAQYMKRMIGIKDINDPDYKGPDVWTTPVKSFEADYIRRNEKNEYGKPSNIWDPNPKAFRLALAFDEAMTVPVAWGTWNVTPGGTLAVREADVAALTDALKSIRDGVKTAHEALLTTNSSGDTVARFDVYGMAPGFLEDNYGAVELSAATQKTLAALKPRTPAVAGQHP